MPQPSTATVGPRSSAPRCAAPSTPRARPETTTTPAAASAAPSPCATSVPYEEQARAPTTATHGRSSSESGAVPRTNSPGGGSWIARRRAGNAGSDRPTQRSPAAWRRPRYAAASKVRSNLANATLWGRVTTCDPVSAANAASTSSGSTAPASSGRTRTRPSPSWRAAVTRRAPRAACRRAPQRRAATRRAPRRQALRSSPRRGRRAPGRGRKAGAARPPASGTPRPRRPLEACRPPGGRAQPPPVRGRRPTARRMGLPARPTRPRNREREVEPVEQGPREPLAVPLDALGRADARRGRIAARAARTEIHRPDQLEPRGEGGAADDPRDRDRPVLEGLPEPLQHRSRELGQLVEVEHASVREAHLAGARPRAPTEDRGCRHGMMRRSERRDPDEPGPARKRSGDRVDAGDLERGGVVERRQDAREAAGEHRLARPGRPDEEQVVGTGCGDLEGAAGPLLTAHVGQVGNRL